MDSVKMKKWHTRLFFSLYDSCDQTLHSENCSNKGPKKVIISVQQPWLWSYPIIQLSIHIQLDKQGQMTAEFSMSYIKYLWEESQLSNKYWWDLNLKPWRQIRPLCQPNHGKKVPRKVLNYSLHWLLITNINGSLSFFFNRNVVTCNFRSSASLYDI